MLGQKQRQLVPQTETTKEIAAMPNPFDILGPSGGEPAFWTTLNLDDPKEAWVAKDIFVREVDDMDKWVNKTFTVCHIVRHPFEKQGDGGELYQLVRTILISPNLKEAVSFPGRGATGCLRRICSIPGIGLPPWKNGIPLVVGSVQLANNQRTHTLTLPEGYLESIFAERGSAPKVRR